jgi:TetR/AcrR family transcriptional regulator, transcriptional repressor for nem operon
MTDSTSQRPGKRERLVASATELVHSQGFERTTLAEIAEAAEVPPGNVYYYFKTKDDLVRAVIESRAERVDALLASLDRRSSPTARLKALTRTWAEADELVAANGCPMGTLCSELNKQADGLDRDAARLFERLIDWAEDQFREMGRKDARELAFTLFAGVQGAALLSNTFRDPKLMRSQVRRLERWIDSLD